MMVTRKMFFIRVKVNVAGTPNLKLHPKRGFENEQQAYQWVLDNIVLPGWPSYEGKAKATMWLPSDGAWYEGSFNNVMVFTHMKSFHQ